MLRFALPLSVLLAASAHAAPVRVEFWHAMDGVQ
ncbi:MAG: glycerol-3-phosphate transporter substrate-binding protein, partial [Deinococcus sp.]|nr:glycerol-3-phosphate transporter substrate-binding protein [Deinococcus sp.]